MNDTTRMWRFGHPDLDPEVERTGVQTTGTGSIALIGGDLAVRQSLLLLLTTVPGERVMRPEYGCPLHRLAFSPADETTAGLAIHYVRQAVTRFMPEVEVVDVDAAMSVTDPEKLTVWLRYRVRKTTGEQDLAVEVPLQEGG